MAGANRREAALAGACRVLVAAYKAGLRDGGSIDWNVIDQAHELAKEALAIKPGGPEAASVVEIDVRGGVVQDIKAPRGVSVVVRDWDNCGECGGVECEGGYSREAVHGPDCEREARLRNREARP